MYPSLDYLIEEKILPKKPEIFFDENELLLGKFMFYNFDGDCCRLEIKNTIGETTSFKILKEDIKTLENKISFFIIESKASTIKDFDFSYRIGNYKEFIYDNQNQNTTVWSGYKKVDILKIKNIITEKRLKQK